MQSNDPTLLTRSVRLSKGEQLLPDTHEDGSGAALVIRGDNLTIDFGGFVLRGTPQTAEPDARRGTGILVQGRNVTLKNPHVHGYKIGVFAKDCPGLRILGGDFSYNWKQRLLSTPEKEDLADWMSFHQNEKEEWLRFGAGIYLRGCDGFEVKGVTIRGGQCGLMLTGCNKGTVWNNDFSFLSAIGLGMYRSSENKVMHNNIDWCLRGFSYGVYNRGQDSAGILIYEQSHRNIFAYNSVTHSGDGFFLWAGQTTMDTGKGGCNDNLLYGNDFSHAPTNGIEATFSRNIFVNNLLLECWHGVWGGYSYESVIEKNTFGANVEGIALEHGQDNRIVDNIFTGDGDGVVLWANANPPDPNWGYPKHRDTRSRDTLVRGNTFLRLSGQAVRLTRSENMTVDGNRIVGTATKPLHALASKTLTDTEYAARFVTAWKPFAGGEHAPKPLPGGKKPFLKPTARRGWRYMFVDEWGPYDFNAPKLLPRIGEAGGTRTFEILGPTGKWRAKSVRGATLSAQAGDVPGNLTATYSNQAKGGEVSIQLEYVGTKTTDYRGITSPAGKPVTFGFAEFVAPIDWKVRFYTWEKDKSDPRTQPDAFAERLKLPPVATQELRKLDYAGYGFTKGVPNNYFATVAEGVFEIVAGEYILEITTDDGCRAWLDGIPLLTEAWKYQGPTLYPVKVKLGGTHHLRVEHFQIDGYATLRAILKKG